jgi:peptide alpha-N-acetyltransferase
MLLSRNSFISSTTIQSDRQTEEAMASIYNASYVSLHVRKSNKAAIALYRDTLGFEVAKVEKAYCASTILHHSYRFELSFQTVMGKMPSRCVSP